jgi:hypothetical protein
MSPDLTVTVGRAGLGGWAEDLSPVLEELGRAGLTVLALATREEQHLPTRPRSPTSPGHGHDPADTGKETWA